MPAPVPPPPAPAPCRPVPLPMPRTVVAAFIPLRALATVWMVPRVCLISSPVSELSTSLMPPRLIAGRISPEYCVSPLALLAPSFPSAPLIFSPSVFCFLSALGPSPWPPPLSCPASGGGGGSITARRRPKRAARSSALVSSRGLAIWSGVIKVRSTPSTPKCSTPLETSASSTSSSTESPPPRSGGALVYWKKMDKSPYCRSP